MKLIRTAASIVLFATAAFAATPSAPAPASPKDFANGPAQWLMTRQEKSAWRSVKTDQQAQDLIDLFWARRDPTPGTPRNEFHEQFDQRVQDADVYFPTAKTRGAMTDKGRVYIVLGPPPEYQTTAGKIQDLGIQTTGDTSFGGAHELGGRDTFDYPNGHSLGLTGPIVFIQDLRTKEYHYDLQHANVGGALASGVTRSIINPGLTTVPEWATAKAIAESHQRVAIVQAPKTTAVVPAAAAVQPAGVHTLVLLKDVGVLNPRGKSDPFASAANVSSFTKQDDLGYGTNLCVAKYDPENPPTIKVAMTITGESAGQKVRMVAPEDDFTPDAISTLPGCYLVRGALPLADFGAGAYKLSLTLTDPTSQQKYNLEQSFKVE